MPRHKRRAKSILRRKRRTTRNTARRRTARRRTARRKMIGGSETGALTGSETESVTESDDAIEDDTVANELANELEKDVNELIAGIKKSESPEQRPLVGESPEQRPLVGESPGTFTDSSQDQSPPQSVERVVWRPAVSPGSDQTPIRSNAVSPGSGHTPPRSPANSLPPGSGHTPPRSQQSEQLSQQSVQLSQQSKQSQYDSQLASSDIDTLFKDIDAIEKRVEGREKGSTKAKVSKSVEDSAPDGVDSGSGEAGEADKRAAVPFDDISAQKKQGTEHLGGVVSGEVSREYHKQSGIYVEKLQKAGQALAHLANQMEEVVEKRGRRTSRSKVPHGKVVIVLKYHTGQIEKIQEHLHCISQRGVDDNIYSIAGLECVVELTLYTITTGFDVMGKAIIYTGFDLHSLLDAFKLYKDPLIICFNYLNNFAKAMENPNYTIEKNGKNGDLLVYFKGQLNELKELFDSKMKETCRIFVEHGLKKDVPGEPHLSLMNAMLAGISTGTYQDPELHLQASDANNQFGQLHERQVIVEYKDSMDKVYRLSLLDYISELATSPTNLGQLKKNLMSALNANRELCRALFGPLQETFDGVYRKCTTTVEELSDNILVTTWSSFFRVLKDSQLDALTKTIMVENESMICLNLSDYTEQYFNQFSPQNFGELSINLPELQGLFLREEIPVADDVFNSCIGTYDGNIQRIATDHPELVITGLDVNGICVISSESLTANAYKFRSRALITELPDVFDSASLVAVIIASQQAGIEDEDEDMDKLRKLLKTTQDDLANISEQVVASQDSLYQVSQSMMANPSHQSTLDVIQEQKNLKQLDKEQRRLTTLTRYIKVLIKPRDQPSTFTQASDQNRVQSEVFTEMLSLEENLCRDCLTVVGKIASGSVPLKSIKPCKTHDCPGNLDFGALTCYALAKKSIYDESAEGEPGAIEPVLMEGDSGIVSCIYDGNGKVNGVTEIFHRLRHFKNSISGGGGSSSDREMWLQRGKLNLRNKIEEYKVVQLSTNPDPSLCHTNYRAAGHGDDLVETNIYKGLFKVNNQNTLTLGECYATGVRVIPHGAVSGATAVCHYACRQQYEHVLASTMLSYIFGLTQNPNLLGGAFTLKNCLNGIFNTLHERGIDFANGFQKYICELFTNITIKVRGETILLSALFFNQPKDNKELFKVIEDKSSGRFQIYVDIPIALQIWDHMTDNAQLQGSTTPQSSYTPWKKYPNTYYDQEVLKWSPQGGQTINSNGQPIIGNTVNNLSETEIRRHHKIFKTRNNHSTLQNFGVFLFNLRAVATSINESLEEEIPIHFANTPYQPVRVWQIVAWCTALQGDPIYWITRFLQSQDPNPDKSAHLKNIWYINQFMEWLQQLQPPRTGGGKRKTRFKKKGRKTRFKKKGRKTKSKKKKRKSKKKKRKSNRKKRRTKSKQ